MLIHCMSSQLLTNVIFYLPLSCTGSEVHFKDTNFYKVVTPTTFAKSGLSAT